MLCLPKTWEQLRVRRGTPKTVTRERQLNSLLRRMWFGYRYQAAMSFPGMNPKHMFIYSGLVYRIQPQGLQILTPTYFQHFQEVRNTAWFITVPNIENKCMIEGWVKRGVIAQLLPF